MSDGFDSMPIASRTDVGQRREHNEDAVLARTPLIAVADGVGGSAKGEVASQLALDTLVLHTPEVASARTSDDAIQAMDAAVVAANHAVFGAQQADDTLRGMATTLTAAVIRDGGEIIVGHVGDSRLYVVSAAGARQASEDHSVVAELVRTGRLEPEAAAHHPQRNVITRALGSEPDVSVDAFLLHVGPGDWLLTCSDGLTEHVLDDELAQIMLKHGSTGIDAALDELVALANERGGTDNITVAVAQPVPSDVSGELRIDAIDAVATTAQLRTVQPSDAPAEASGPLPVVDMDDEIQGVAPFQSRDMEWGDEDRFDRRRPRWIMPAVIATVIVIAAVVGAAAWSASYFLVERSDGIVGINRGFPVWRFSSPYRSSTVAADELTAADREKLVNSHRILSRADAVRVLNDLPDRVTDDKPLEETGDAAGTSDS
jgi:protein phosphatase